MRRSHDRPYVPGPSGPSQASKPRQEDNCQYLKGGVRQAGVPLIENGSPSGRDFEAGRYGTLGCGATRAQAAGTTATQASRAQVTAARARGEAEGAGAGRPSCRARTGAVMMRLCDHDVLLSARNAADAVHGAGGALCRTGCSCRRGFPPRMLLRRRRAARASAQCSGRRVLGFPRACLSKPGCRA